MTTPKTRARKAENSRIQQTIERLPSGTDTRQMARDISQQLNVSRHQVYGNLSFISRSRFRIIQVVVPRKRSVLL